jgi:hypothetical protein
LPRKFTKEADLSATRLRRNIPILYDRKCAKIGYVFDPGSNTYKLLKCDTNPKKIADWATKPSSRKDCNLINEQLKGASVLYIFKLDEYSESVEIGISDDLGDRIYEYGRWYKSIPKGKSKFKYIKLTPAISRYRIEKFILFYAFVKGYKIVNGEYLHGECVRDSDEVLNDLIRFLCLINKNKGIEIQFDNEDGTYWINNKMCDGQKGGTTSYLGPKGMGQYNIAAHPLYKDFLKNLGRAEEDEEDDEEEGR